MLQPRLALSFVLLLLASMSSASAQEDSAPRAAGAAPQGFDQVVYKGLIGNVLDAIPMEPLDRLQLQRTNAVVSSTLLGRSLTVLTSLSNPVLLLGGLVWGMWSASNIKPEETALTPTADSRRSGSGTSAQPAVALLDRSSATEDIAINAVEPVLVSAVSTDVGPATLPNPHVLKIWTTQRSSVLQR